MASYASAGHDSCSKQLQHHHHIGQLIRLEQLSLIIASPPVWQRKQTVGSETIQTKDKILEQTATMTSQQRTQDASISTSIVATKKTSNETSIWRSDCGYEDIFQRFVQALCISVWDSCYQGIYEPAPRNQHFHK